MAKVASSDMPAGTSGRRAALWWGAAGLAIVLGFADLWRGGETVAPILLIAGYCILIPAAILKR